VDLLLIEQQQFPDQVAVRWRGVIGLFLDAALGIQHAAGAFSIFTGHD
jgi:hypothetical protein